MSSARTRIRLLVTGTTVDGERAQGEGEDSSWAAWVAARDASAEAARIVLQRVSRKGNPESQPAVGLGYGEILRWFGPVSHDAVRRLIIEYAEQVLAAGSFVPPGPELQTLAWAPDAAPPRAAATGIGSTRAVNAGVAQARAANNGAVEAGATKIGRAHV